MNSVGALLRTARESQGRSIEEISGETRIPVRYLSALETNDPSQLPAAFFFRNFARQYAEHLGIFDAKFETVLDQQMPPKPSEIALVDEAPDAEANVDRLLDRSPLNKTGPLPWGTIVGSLLAMAAIGGIGYWVYVGGLASVWAEWSKPRAAVDAPRAVETQAPRSTVAVPAPAAPQVAPPEPEPEAAPPEQVTPAAPPPPSLPADGRVQVTITATEQSWINLREDDRVVFNGMLEAGQQKTITARESAFVFTGNAGGVEVTWNGQSLGRLGPKGRPRRVLYYPDKWRDVAPPAKPQTSTP